MLQFAQITPAHAVRLIGTPDAATGLELRIRKEAATQSRPGPPDRRVVNTGVVAATDPRGRAVVACTGGGRKPSEGAAPVRTKNRQAQALQHLAAGMTVCDVLYRRARDGHEEGHDWQQGRPE